MIRIGHFLQLAASWWLTHTVPIGLSSRSVMEREQARKAQLLSVGSFFCLAMSLPLVIDSLIIYALSSVLILAIFICCIIGALVLNRVARYNWASLVYIGGYLISASWGLLWIPATVPHMYLYAWVQLVLPPIFAGLFLPYWTPLVFATLDCLIITLIEIIAFARDPGVWLRSPSEQGNFFLYIYVMMFAIAFISAVYARSVEQAVLKADRAAEVEQAHAELRAAYAKLEYVATIDPITGLLNHRALNTQLALEEANARRTGVAFGLIFADIDHFKHVNDTWGHQVGDDVLAHVSALLRQHVRTNDLVARYGGEEFVMLLPGQECQEGLQTAERLRAAIANAPMKLPDGDDLTITLSLGVAIFPTNATTANRLITAADAAMYQAKHNGRNRVCATQDRAQSPPDERAA